MRFPHPDGQPKSYKEEEKRRRKSGEAALTARPRWRANRPRQISTADCNMSADFVKELSGPMSQHFGTAALQPLMAVV
jgi:hypothetical protein